MNVISDKLIVTLNDVTCHRRKEGKVLPQPHLAVAGEQSFEDEQFKMNAHPQNQLSIIPRNERTLSGNDLSQQPSQRESRIKRVYLYLHSPCKLRVTSC